MVDAQEGGFDLLSGETLFHQGSGITGSHVYSSRRGVDDHSFVAGMSYGVVPWLTASALLPWIHRNVDAESSQGADLDFSLEGVGDVDLLAKFRAHHHQWQGGGSLAWSLIAGLSVPTGDDDQIRDGQRVPASLQIGTGSWDPFAATAVTVETGRWRYDGNIVYQQGFKGELSGETLATQLEVRHRFWLSPFPGPSASAKVGLRWCHEARGARAERLLLRTGISSHPRPDLDLGLSIELPIWQQLDDDAWRMDLRTQLVVGIRF